METNKRRQENHAVEEGFAFSIREFTKGMAPECIGKTRRGRLNNAAFHLKKRAMKWADEFPKKIDGMPSGFTPAVRIIGKHCNQLFAFIN